MEPETLIYSKAAPGSAMPGFSYEMGLFLRILTLPVVKRINFLLHVTASQNTPLATASQLT